MKQEPCLVGKADDILQRIIFPDNSHGRLGGKSTGLLLASQILRKSSDNAELFRNIKTPKTWYITSDAILSFIHYNNLEDVIDQKYKEITQVRQEYPYVVQVFKNSQFPPEVIKGLSVALDDFGDHPLIVRSSSLLEDRLGTSFAGKYKSLFIANQGSKEVRLAALMDAVAEVYASVFSPDPIEYRNERGLMDYHEEMAIMIQEVVGTPTGMLETIVGQAMRERAGPTPNPRLAALILTFLPVMLALRRWSLYRSLTHEKLVDGLTDFLVRGLGLDEGVTT